MKAILDACPFEAATRASRCESCCETASGVPPCVAAWLSIRTTRLEAITPRGPAKIIPLYPTLRPAA